MGKKEDRSHKAIIIYCIQQKAIACDENSRVKVLIHS